MAQTIRYVKQGGSGDGLSWATASGDLQATINASGSGASVYVAAGTYQRASGQSFSMKAGVSIYGGFPATGSPAFSQRNSAANTTILQGNNATVISNYYNSLTASALLDGFTVTGGTTNGNGGGISNINSYPQITNCIIKNNTAANWGGGIFNSGAGNTAIINCLLYGNTAGGGGAVFDYNGATTYYLNATIANNHSMNNGGGIHTHQNSAVTIVNSIIYGNTAASAGSQFFSSTGCSVTANYSLFINNGSTVSGTLTGTNNVSGDPGFVNPAAGNYMFANTSSAAYNAASNAAFANAQSAKDLGGTSRISDQIIDIGAYEGPAILIRYVKQGGTGDGSSWATASGDLQSAIDASQTGYSVYVAEGTYQRGVWESFSMKAGVQVYGGFAATGTPVFSERNWAIHTTVLQGNNAAVVKNDTNGLTGTAVLDGFTITGGASGSNGGGIRNIYSYPSIVNCIIRNNTAANWGGGIFNSGPGSTQVKNCLLYGNSASGGGGAFETDGATTSYVNVTIAHNSSTQNGGGIHTYQSAITTVSNSIIYGNTANDSGAQFFSIGGGSVAVNYSLFDNSPAGVSGTITGTNNVSGDPVFINSGAANYKISASSPAKNTGNASLFPNAGSSKDLGGNVRNFANGIDMGAYENQEVLNADGILYVIKGAAGNGSSWANALGELATALVYAKQLNDITPGTINQIWVAKGTYRPLRRMDNIEIADPADRKNAFKMISGVKVYGHFTGNETSLAQRNLDNAANTTILSGDFMDNDTADANGLPSGNLDDNAYHIVVATGISGAALDGFTISGANANAWGQVSAYGYSVENGYGGAIYAYDMVSTPLTNLIIKSNFANVSPGIYCFGNYISVSEVNANHNKGGATLFIAGHGTLENSIISDNDSGSGALGIMHLNAHNIIVKNNHGFNLGGIWLSNATLYNSLISGNTSAEIGGLHVDNNSTMVNCTITGNTGAVAAAIFVESHTTLNLSNSILAFNGSDDSEQIEISYFNGQLLHTNNLVPGSGGSSSWNDSFGTDNGNNIDADPLLADADNGDYSLQDDSPAEDTGSNALYPATAPVTDLGNSARIANGTIDIGAYEMRLSQVLGEEGIMYVVKGASGTGESWNNAVGELADALVTADLFNSAEPGTVTEIWVAKGTYKPLRRMDNIQSISAGDRKNAFKMLSDVKIYGHFSGNETELTQRDLDNAANTTVLSGDFMDNDTADANGLPSGNLGDNAYHIVIATGISGAALDGFTISGANANAWGQVSAYGYSVENGYGGAIYAYDMVSTSLTNLVIKSNTANISPGIYCFGNYISVSEVNANHNKGGTTLFIVGQGTLENSIISDNYSEDGSGALGIMHLNAHNIVVKNNHGYYLGGIWLSNATLSNSLIADNSADEIGGVHVDNNSTMVNCTITGNTGALAGAIFVESHTTLNLSNSILAFNGPDDSEQIEVSYFSGQLLHTNNLVPGSGGSSSWNESFGTDNGNNIDAGPLFADADNGDYSLQDNSPAINVGDASLYPNADDATDLAGNIRVFGPSIDLGAYEAQSIGSCGTVTTWNGSSWNNGTPTSYGYAAAIEGDYDSTTDGEILACSLTVNSGDVVVAGDDTFMIKGVVTITAGSLTIENNGSLIQEDDVENSGNITVIRDSNPLYKLDYTIWSSPVSGQNLQEFSPATLPGRFYQYGIGTDGEEAYLSASAAGNFEEGRGYLIRMPDQLPAPDTESYNTGTLSHVHEGIFTGVPHNGTLEIPMSVQHKFTSMVGNPYPSPVNVAEFFYENQSVLSPVHGLYFWRKRNNTDATSYATLNTIAYTANDGGTLAGTDGVFDDINNYGGQQWENYFGVTPSDEWMIAAGQGFFVVGNGSGGNLKFTNMMRRTADSGQPFFRSNPPTPAPVSRLWFNLNNETNFSQIAVAYTENATSGLDFGMDSKQFSGGKISLYSLAEDKKLGIQARPAFEDSDVVPLGYYVLNAGSYSISLDRKDGLFNDGQPVYLRDNLLNTTYDFAGGHYQFTTEGGTFEDRFEVIYTVSSLDLPTAGEYSNVVTMFKSDKGIHINTGKELIRSVQIFDIRGRLLYDKDTFNVSDTIITDLVTQQQVLIVKVITSEGTIANKKLIF